jgi:hypothetical protein
MKKIILAITVILLATIVNAQPVTYDWAQSLAGKTNYDGFIGMTRDGSGNIYITGEFAGSRSFGSFTLNGSSFSQIFVAKYNSTGTCLWAVKGGANFSTAYAGKVAVSGNSVYVTGYFTNIIDFGGVAEVSAGTKDVFVVSLDANSGAANWVKRGGGTYEDKGLNIVSNGNGGAYVCGSFTDVADFGGVTLTNSSIFDGDIFVVNYDNAGNVVWAKQFGGLINDQAFGITVLTNGEIAITGSFEGTINFGPISLNSVGFADMFLAKLNASGNPVWAVKGGSENTDIAYAVSSDPQGNLYTTGFIADTAVFGGVTINNSQNINVFVAKHNSSGVCQWVRHGGNIIDDIGYDIATDFGGSSYFTGYVSGNSNFGTTILTGVLANDAVVGKYANDGTLRWIARIGAPNIDRGKAIVLDANGFCIVAGDYSDAVMIGNTSLSAGSGVTGIYMARMGGGTVGINENLETGISVYPNPAHDFITVDLSAVTDLAFTVEVITVDGKVLKMEQPVQNENLKAFNIDLTAISSGNYFLKISTSKGDITKSFNVSKR